MKPAKTSKIINLSNQGNTCNVNKTNLLQFNFIVMLGLGYLDNASKEASNTNVSISINQTGELTLSGIDQTISKDEKNIKIYSDKKVTYSEK